MPRPSAVLAAAFAVALSSVSSAWPADRGAGCLRGVNLSGAEIGAVPGRPDHDYVYPTGDDLRRVAGLGFCAVRLPVSWERLQPRVDGELDDRETGRLDAVLDAAATARLAVVIDVHNYGHRGPDRLGTPALPAAALADLWQRIAARYRSHPGVVFGLMNEPHDIPGPEWAAAATGAIAAIRAAGARNLVLVAGTAWDGAHSWTADSPMGNNGRDMLAVRDPLDHFAFEVHQYLDADFSGRSPECSGSSRALTGIDTVAAWLRANKRRGILGEFASSREPACMASLAAMVEHVDKDPEAWIGWTAWAAGPWWPADYPFNLQPTSSGAPPQLALLARRAAAAPPCQPIGSR